jgi:hypothetical protein
MGAAAPALILSDGGVIGLLAVVAAADRRGGLLGTPRQGAWIWVPPVDPATHAARLAAAKTQAEIYGFQVVSDGSPTGLGGGAGAESETATLVQACRLARGMGAATIVWPASAGMGDPAGAGLDRAAAILDRALLVSRLAAIDGGPIEILTPFADLGDRELADVILDMDLPIWTCWWAAELTGEAHRAGLAERAHWMGLLGAAGWVGELPGPADVPEVTSRSASAVAGGTGVEQRGLT